MHDMASKIFQTVMCPPLLFKYYSCKNFQQISIQLVFVFLKTIRNCVALTHFSKMCRTIKRLLSTYRPIHIPSMGHNRGQDSDSLSDKCSAWIQDNFLVKVEIETVNEIWPRFL